MARIRSVHPGLFTDEAFVSCSAAARVLFIGLWTEADDLGAFEWKPVTIKMRLMSGDEGLAAPLLAELEAANMIKRYSAGGREYGAVRNFCRFQRPKKPKSIHPMPPEFRTYVASEAPSSEPGDDDGGSGSPPPPPHGGRVPPKSELTPTEANPVPKKSRISPQMEDGGWRMKKETASAESRPSAPEPSIESRCRHAVGEEPVLVATDFGAIFRLLDEGATEVDVLSGIATGLAKCEPGFRFRKWGQFDGWIRGAWQDRLGTKPRARGGVRQAGSTEPSVEIRGVDVPEHRVVERCAEYRETGVWKYQDVWGAAPDHPGTEIPRRIWQQGAVH